MAKISISLPDEDVEFLDEYAAERGGASNSRSGAVHDAIELLRRHNLESEYAAAFDEWERDGERAAWAGVLNDGLAG